MCHCQKHSTQESHWQPLRCAGYPHSLNYHQTVQFAKCQSKQTPVEINKNVRQKTTTVSQSAVELTALLGALLYTAMNTTSTIHAASMNHNTANYTVFQKNRTKFDT